jgi:multidrug efflux system membrane fusion protein
MRWLVGSAGVWLIMASSGCADTQAHQAVELHRSVRVAAVGEAPAARQVRLDGITRAADRARLGFPQGGRLVARPVRVGDVVERGQVLARLDAGPWANQVSVARARVAELEARSTQLDRDVARTERLDARGSVTSTETERLTVERDAVQAGLRAARSAADEAVRQAEDAVLRAPFAGVVASVNAQPGEMLAPGAPVVELAGSGLEVAVELPERLWAAIDGETVVRVELPALGEALPGELVDLGGVGGGAGGLFPVVVALPDGARRVPGLTARVIFEVPLPEGRVAPIRAVVDPTGGDPAVFVVVDGRARRFPVQVGGLIDDQVVLGGVPAGAPLIVAGHAQLLDGDLVRVLP